MTEIIYYVAASLDGFIATSGGGVEWLSPFESPGEDYGYSEFYASVDSLLMGSRTYEQILGFGQWPYPDKPSWVFSRRLNLAARPNVTITPGKPDEMVSELKARNLKRTWLVGGGELASSFRYRGLIAEYLVSLIPIILGAGVPLFAQPGPRENLMLADSKSFPGGLAQLRYLREKVT